MEKKLGTGLESLENEKKNSFLLVKKVIKDNLNIRDLKQLERVI